MINITQQRNTILKKRKALSADAINKAGESIWQHLKPHPFFQEATHIAFYMPFNNEVPTQTMIEQAHLMGKKIYLPVVQDDFSLQFTRYRSTDPLIKNNMGIDEPTSNETLPPEQLSLVIVPGLVYSHAGHRLGYGKGCYDRTFACLASPHTSFSTKTPKLIAPAYAFQVIEPWTPKSHDIPMHAVFTEKTIY